MVSAALLDKNGFLFFVAFLSLVVEAMDEAGPCCARVGTRWTLWYIDLELGVTNVNEPCPGRDGCE